MDPTDLSSMGDLASNGADLAANPPDIQINVAPSSFDLGANYTQDAVTGIYSPAGIPIGAYGADATMSTLANQACVPTGTEDAIAYTASLDVNPSYQDTVAPTDFTNTASGGPVDPNSMGTQPTDATAGMPNPSLGGIKDAISGLVALTAAGARMMPNRNTVQQRTPMPTLGTQQRGGAPMTAGRAAGALGGSQGPVDPGARPRLSPAHMALMVGAVGLLAIGVSL